MAAIGPSGLENVKTLVASGADLNYQDSISGNTPLIQAADLNQFDIVYYLLDRGADYKLKNKFGNTVVFDIEMNNIDPKSTGYAWRQKVIEFLRSKGVSVNPKTP
jgi:ankyrin repeat protein